MSVCMIKFCVSAAPLIAPENVKIDRNGTTMTVSWTPLTLVESRGIVDFYQVFFSNESSQRKQQNGNTCSSSPCEVPGDSNSVVITGLDSSVDYSVSVSAVNDVDEGPTSDPVTAEGEYMLLIVATHTTLKVKKMSCSVPNFTE